MKLAIHHQSGNDSYSDRWIEYCKNNNIEYEIVNCYNSNILKKLKQFDALLWHWQHTDYKAKLFANSLIFSLDTINYPVYPNLKTSFFFDDKLAQKYILEAIDAPFIKSYIFFTKEEALEWIEKTKFPKVFKLRSGAGSFNVTLIKSKSEARRYIDKIFKRGFLPTYRTSILKEKIWHFQREKSIKNFFNISKGLFRCIFPNKVYKELPLEKNYLYAQDFIPNCNHDIRVFVIGSRAVTKKRMVRKGDFRASGSGKMSWDIGEEGRECVRIAFELTKRLKAQSLAFDFIRDKSGYKIVEISYSASPRGFVEALGYWNENLEWIDKKPIRVEHFIIEDFIKSIKK